MSELGERLVDDVVDDLDDMESDCENLQVHSDYLSLDEVSLHSPASSSSSYRMTPQGAKSRYKHVPHCEKPPQVVEKRNARERKRVQTVNSAFIKLRKYIPYENRHKRLSKVKTLHKAIEYIQHLQQLVETYDDGPELTEHTPHTALGPVTMPTAHGSMATTDMSAASITGLCHDFVQNAAGFGMLLGSGSAPGSMEQTYMASSQATPNVFTKQSQASMSQPMLADDYADLCSFGGSGVDMSALQGFLPSLLQDPSGLAPPAFMSALHTSLPPTS